MSNAKDKAADEAIAEAKEAKPYEDKVKYGRVASPPPAIVVNEFDLDEKLDDVEITIVEPGLVGSNAFLQGVEFKNGKNVEPATRRQIDRIAASLRVSIEGGDFKTISQRVNDRDTKIEPGEKLERDVKVVSVKPAKDGVKLWTQAELAAIADDKGINGLREIADPLKLRSRSIPELIGKIMAEVGVDQPVEPEQTFSEADKPVEELETDEDETPVIETPEEPVAEGEEGSEGDKDAEVKSDEDAKSDDEAKPDAVETADVKPEGSETDGKQTTSGGSGGS